MSTRDGSGKSASRRRARADEDSDLDNSVRRKKGNRRDAYESESESDERRSNKKRKAESSKAKSIAGERKGASGEIFWDLPDKRRLTVSDFKGKTYIGIREFYEQDGELKPGKRGINLTVDQFQQAYLLMPNVATYLRAHGADLSRLEEADEQERRREKETRKKRERERLSTNITSSPSQTRTGSTTDGNGFRSGAQSEAEVGTPLRVSNSNGMERDRGHPNIKSEERIVDSDRDAAIYEIAAHPESQEHRAFKRELTPPLSLSESRRARERDEESDEDGEQGIVNRALLKKRRKKYEASRDED